MYFPTDTKRLFNINSFIIGLYDIKSRYMALEVIGATHNKTIPQVKEDIDFIIDLLSYGGNSKGQIYRRQNENKT